MRPAPTPASRIDGFKANHKPEPAAFSALARLRSRFANFIARCAAFVALRCLAWTRLRRESDILGMTLSSMSRKLGVLGKSLRRNG
jgi:hypothetical protein